MACETIVWREFRGMESREAATSGVFRRRHQQQAICSLNRLVLTYKHMGLDDIYRGSCSGGDEACDHTSTQVGTKVIANTGNPHDGLLYLIICCTLRCCQHSCTCLQSAIVKSAHKHHCLGATCESTLQPH